MVENKNLNMFVRFLKEENVYKKYISEYMCENNPYRKLYYNNRRINDFFMYIQEYCAFENVIYDSFPWARTKDGYGFWRNINKRWKDLYRYGKK